MGVQINCADFGKLVKTAADGVVTAILHGPQTSRLRAHLLDETLLQNGVAIQLTQQVYSHLRYAANDRYLQIVVDMTSGLSDVELYRLFETLKQTNAYVFQLILVHDHDYFIPTSYERSRLSLAQLTASDKVGLLILHDSDMEGNTLDAAAFGAIYAHCGGNGDKVIWGWGEYEAYIAPAPQAGPGLWLDPPQAEDEGVADMVNQPFSPG